MNSRTGIIAFAFGKPANITPNVHIAHIATRQAQILKTKIYTEPDIVIGSDIDTTTFQPTPDKQPSTLQMAGQAVIWAQENNYQEIIVVAASLHMWRCIRDLKMCCRESGLSIKIIACQTIQNQYPARFWLYQDSQQKRTRSMTNWLLREAVLRIIPFSLYKKLTG